MGAGLTGNMAHRLEVESIRPRGDFLFLWLTRDVKVGPGETGIQIEFKSVGWIG